MLAVALPLIVQTCFWSVMWFIDRLFLTWYSREATHGKIPTILENPLPDSTKLFIANAVYFKGKWLTPFDKAGSLFKSCRGAFVLHGLSATAHQKWPYPLVATARVASIGDWSG